MGKYKTPDDPAMLDVWPPTFPIEVALRVAPIKEICEAHGITRDEWARLQTNPAFHACLAGYVKLLKEEGMSFKLKARLQSEEYLKTSYELIHGVDTPANIKADLIKYTWRVAGLDASVDQKNLNQNNNQNNFQINLVLRGD